VFSVGHYHRCGQHADHRRRERPSQRLGWWGSTRTLYTLETGVRAVAIGQDGRLFVLCSRTQVYEL
jgi:hypothetical protein